MSSLKEYTQNPVDSRLRIELNLDVPPAAAAAATAFIQSGEWLVGRRWVWRSLTDVTAMSPWRGVVGRVTLEVGPR